MRNNPVIHREESAVNLPFQTRALLQAEQVLALLNAAPEPVRSLHREADLLRDSLLYCDPCSTEAVAAEEESLLQLLGDLVQELRILPEMESQDTERLRYLMYRFERELKRRNALLLALKKQV